MAFALVALARFAQCLFAVTCIVSNGVSMSPAAVSSPCRGSTYKMRDEIDAAFRLINARATLARTLHVDLHERAMATSRGRYLTHYDLVVNFASTS